MTECADHFCFWGKSGSRDCVARLPSLGLQRKSPVHGQTDAMDPLRNCLLDAINMSAGGNRSYAGRSRESAAVRHRRHAGRHRRASLAFNKVFGPRGHVFDHARFTKELQGFSNASISERFLAGEPPKRQSAIIGEKEEAFRKLVSGQIQPLPGLMKLLALADRASIPMVAVTNAPRLNAEMLLSGLGIMDRFKVVVIGDELPHGKLHPMPYLEGLRAVNAAPPFVRRVRRFSLRHKVGIRRRHCDCGNTDES